VVACNADGGSFRARHDMGSKTKALDFGADIGDILLGSLGAHHN
jgi:hypothetical protein